MYEKGKNDPDVPRDAPPAAGAIYWSRRLLAHIEGPMKVGHDILLHYCNMYNIYRTDACFPKKRPFPRFSQNIPRFCENLWFFILPTGTHISVKIRKNAH